MWSSEPGHERCRDDERRGRGEVAGHLDLDRLQPLGRLDRDALLAPRDRGAGRLEHQLGVVARRLRLDDRRLALGVEPGEEDRRLDLRARDRQLVGDRAQRPALDPERQVPVVGLDAGAHAAERLGDPLHRPAAERGVAGELELLPLLAREDPGEEADEGARVGAVDRPAGSDEPSQALAEDVQRVLAVLVDGDPEGANRLDRRLGVGRAAEAGDARLAVADRAEQDRAVGDRLVAGHGDVPDEARDRLDPHSSITGATTTP